MPASPTALKACPLFAGFTDTGLKIFAKIARSRDVAKGMSVFLAGSSGDSLFIVESGELMIQVGQGDAARTLCTVKTGGHFGELALLRSGKRGVTARAGAASKIIEIKRADFNASMKKTPQACFKLMLSIFNAVAKRTDEIQGDLIGLV